MSKPYSLIAVAWLLVISLSTPCWGRELTDGGVTWRNFFDHAVNVHGMTRHANKQGMMEHGLDDFLAGPTPIAEGDIMLNSSGEAVMAHQADEANDARHPTFKVWLQKILSSDASVDPERYLGLTKKGVKLDIKENPALNAHLGLGHGAASAQVRADIKALFEEPGSGLGPEILEKRFIIANADIVQGPGGREPATTVVDLLAWRFTFPGMRLSLGYEQDCGQAPYSRYMMHTQLANAVALGGPLDFNLRAVRIRPSLALIQEQVRLALSHPNITSLTLTIWNAPQCGDPSPTADDLHLYLSRLLPRRIPAGKTAAVLLDLQPAHQ